MAPFDEWLLVMAQWTHGENVDSQEARGLRVRPTPIEESTLLQPRQNPTEIAKPFQRTPTKDQLLSSTFERPHHYPHYLTGDTDLGACTKPSSNHS